jgi:hypothetical protein
MNTAPTEPGHTVYAVVSACKIMEQSPSWDPDIRWSRVFSHFVEAENVLLRS